MFGNEIEVEIFPLINKYTVKLCNPAPGDDVMGPGTLYFSCGEALYMNDGCVDEHITIAMAVDDAPGPNVTIETDTVVDGSAVVSTAVINRDSTDECVTILTGALSMRVGPGQTVRYAGGTVTLGGQSFSAINEFCVVARATDGRPQYGRFTIDSAPTNVRGPGQLYVGGDEALFLGEIGGGTVAPATIVDKGVVENTFTFNSVGNIVGVTDSAASPITVLSNNTVSLDIPAGSSATYDGDQLTIQGSSGQVYQVNGITRFSVFDDNELIVNPATFDFSTSGTLLGDPIENTCIYLSDSNSAANGIFTSFTPETEAVTYDIETDSDNVRNLVRRSGTPPDTESESIQTITGSYVTNVASSEAVVYSDNEIRIKRFDGTTRVRIGNVDEIFTNTAGNPSGEFIGSAPNPFRGPGTFSYSRGTGFYTTDRELGNNIGFQSRTAPIPSIRYEATPIGVNEVDGVNYTVSTVTKTIGGDRVINYEAKSYTTTTEQEIVYADNIVSVHSPIFTSGEDGKREVSYDGGSQQLTYTDRDDGVTRTLTGILTFNWFSGGDVTTAMPGEDVTLQGPGKIYVSVDETTATFSTSDIITPDIVNLIRDSPTDFAVGADQLGSIINTVFNLSTDTATVTYDGGGVIYYSTFNESRDALYIDNEVVEERNRRAVSSLLTLTKHEPAKDTGLLRIFFNGRDIYSYSPITGNREIRISSGGSFEFVGMTLRGLPGGPYSEYNMITVFDGIEVKEVNSSATVQQFEGPGYLLIPQDSDKAFYTTFPPATNYLTQSIQILRNFLVAPRIRAGEGRITTKNRFDEVAFGTDVTAFEGADITFNCDVEGGRPEPIVGFYRILSDGTVVKLNDTMDEIVIVGNSLILLSVRMDDQGQYVCIASNGVPPDATASSTLTVREAGE